MLVELRKMEQRYDAVLGVIRDGCSVRDVAEAYGVSRQSVHARLPRYEKGGLPALADPTPPSKISPLQMAAAVEARGPRTPPAQPHWGQITLRHRLEKRGYGTLGYTSTRATSRRTSSASCNASPTVPPPLGARGMMP